MMFTASRGQARSNSDSTTYNKSHVSEGNAVNITSGADTNVVGGNIKAPQVTAAINNGILNTEDQAAIVAYMQSTGMQLQDGVLVVVNPKINDVISEAA